MGAPRQNAGLFFKMGARDHLFEFAFIRSAADEQNLAALKTLAEFRDGAHRKILGLLSKINPADDRNNIIALREMVRLSKVAPVELSDLNRLDPVGNNYDAALGSSLQ